MCKIVIEVTSDTAEAMRQAEVIYLKKALAPLLERPVAWETESQSKYEQRLGEWLMDRDRRLQVQFIKGWITSLEGAQIVIIEDTVA